MPGRKIFTATRTGGLSLVWARCTWAMEAAPIAAPKLENNTSTGLPNARGISGPAALSGKGGKRSCKSSRARAPCGRANSGRGAPPWPPFY